MEPSILFTELVLGMCAIHLVRQASDAVTRWWARRHPGHAVSAQSAKKVVRSDWYVFFSYSDLVGRKSRKIEGEGRNSAGQERPRRNVRRSARV